LTCEPQWSGRLGQTDYEIMCTARLNPAPLQVIWEWKSATDGETEIYNEVINNNDLAEVALIFCVNIHVDLRADLAFLVVDKLILRKL